MSQTQLGAPLGTMPAVTLRGINVFPNVPIHFDVARDCSIKALEESFTTGSPVFLVTQRNPVVEQPEQRDLYNIGTIAAVRQILHLPDNSVRVMVEGASRGRLLSVERVEPFMLVAVEPIPAEPTPSPRSSRVEALLRQLYGLLQRYIEMSEHLTIEVYLKVLASDDLSYICDYVAQNLPLRCEDKQSILAELRPVRRLDWLVHILAREVEILEIEGDLQVKLHERMAEDQREYFLREQMKVIQQELGEGDADDEIAEYRARLSKAKLPDEVRERLEKEIHRLSKQPFGSADASVIRGYLDTCLELPWQVRTRERVSVSAVKKALDADHFGLTKVKERILEYVAVKQLAPGLKGQILCLVGPPGVGKTSIATSMARAMNRKLARISLGGVHDEAEIRGHRKTYVGSMPGRIIAAVKQAGSSNPLLVLDEIDKVGSDHRGDPASALLEVLDAEQNAAFRDNYLELPFDLSDVMFVTTANTTDTIPRPLLDRMEVIELSSYTDEEKLQIAKQHLLPRQIKRHGLKKSQLRLTDDAIREVIRGYTRESGVRVLERELAALCRKTAVRLVNGEIKQAHLGQGEIEQYLGVRRYLPDELSAQELVGVVNGLAWTSVGGELLEVEVNVVPGTGKVELTGNLGDVMKESAQAALSYIRSRSARLGIEPGFYKDKDIHVHFPEGAVPKDGPSAGIAITTAMVSALTDTPVRKNLAMTGEVTLRGRVLPIGGLREKTMAALRSGITTVILPKGNQKDLEEIDQTVRAGLRFVAVEQVDQVLAEALTQPSRAMEAAAPGPALEELKHPALNVAPLLQ